MEPGIYEVLITEALRTELGLVGSRFDEKVRPLHSAEAADRIALHLSRYVQRALDSVNDRERVHAGIKLARDLITRIAQVIESDTSEAPVEPGEVLRAILERRPDGTPAPIAEPLIPLLDTTLLTNAPGDPGLLHQLDAEIESSDAIDVVMAFIRRSGINPLLSSLRRHCERGKELRVLTTIYTGSTERHALEQLIDIGAQVRISYDVSTTRLHAKAWIFHRRSGFSTAYVGSSNLTHSAQVTGLEWNIRASAARNPDIIAKCDAVFESYWQSVDFVDYDSDRFNKENERADRTDSGLTVALSPIEIRLEPFQERLLERIALSRIRGHHRNLLVAATGTGKTRDHLLEISARDHHRMPRPLSKVSLRQPTARTQRPLHNPRHHRRTNIRCINDMQHGILGPYRPSLQKPRPHGRAQPNLPVGRSNPNNAVRQRNLRRPQHHKNNVTPATPQRRHGRTKPSGNKHLRLAVSPTRPSR
ncbi:hypothetical protein A9X01_02700 [Mycobacterium asiaticum]|uniref:PLD phosphodiesterase domain-containing protein n=1 Tax=Mycobacterium asiaticum TaxID=1790 RepID=A0A1A3BS12_MYCAS|nr:hypothetical protein A9X01_02700 [Mycobacterium asiaticum]